MQPNVRERCSKMLFPVAESGYFCDAVKIEYRGPDQNGIFWTKARKTFWLFRAFKTGPAYLRFDLNWCLHLLPITRKTTNVSMIKDYSFNIEQRAYKIHWVKQLKNIFLARLKKYFSEGQRKLFLYQYMLTPFKFIEKNYCAKKGLRKSLTLKWTQGGSFSKAKRSMAAQKNR